jgi:hypothetical protein
MIHFNRILMACHVGNALSKIADTDEIHKDQAWSPPQKSGDQTGASFQDNTPSLLLVKRACESVLKTFIHRS